MFPCSLGIIFSKTEGSKSHNSAYNGKIFYFYTSYLAIGPLFRNYEVFFQIVTKY